MESVSGIWDKLANPVTPNISTTVCCWLDLLGFGSALYESNWNPPQEVMESVHKRVFDAHQICYQTLSPFHEFVLTLNDGIVRCCKVETLSHIDFLSLWLRGCIDTHIRINEHEKKNGLPGARTMIAVGKQLVHSHSEIKLDDFVYNYSKENPDKISKVAEKAGNPIVAINPIPLQMNMAFSKAYILDSLGSKVGLSGPNFFIEDQLLSFISHISKELSTAYSPVDKRDDSQIFYGLPSRPDGTRYHLAFEFANKPISIITEKIKTTMLKLKAFYPFDEDVADFKYELV